MNQITVMGNLGHDAQIKEAAGRQFLAFSVADTYKAPDGTQQTQWWDVVSGQTTMQPYLTKGKPIYVQGRLRLRAYTNKQGEAVAAPSISASRVEFVPQERNTAADGQQAPDGIQPQATAQHPKQPAYTQYQQPAAQSAPPAMAAQGAPDDLPF